MKAVHILIYRFKPGVDRVDEHLEAIRAFEGKTPGLSSLECGRNLSTSPSGERFTHGFVMTFDSSEALEAYRKSPAHREFVKRFKDDVEAKAIFDPAID